MQSNHTLADYQLALQACQSRTTPSENTVLEDPNIKDYDNGLRFSSASLGASTQGSRLTQDDSTCSVNGPATWSTSTTPSTIVTSPDPILDTKRPIPRPLGTGPREQHKTQNLSFRCQDCGKTFTREKDLRRHARLHQPDPPQYHCPVAGCPRVGANGFSRKDKMVEHLKAKKHRGDNVGQYLEELGAKV